MERQPEDATLVRNYIDSLTVALARCLSHSKFRPPLYPADTLHANPQYQIALQPAAGDDNASHSYNYISLMQESLRALRNFVHQEEAYSPAGFVIYKVKR